MQIFIHKILFAIIVSFATIFIYGCGTTPESNMLPELQAQKETSVSHKIAIVNASKNIINTIKYKPCGTQTTRYQYLTGNLRPSEKFTINIYTQCVDLLATNAFKKKLVDIRNVNLTTTKTWTIK